MINTLQLTDYLPDYPGNFGNTLIALCKQSAQGNGLCIVSFPAKRAWHDLLLQVGGKVVYLPVYKFKEKKIDFYSLKQAYRIIKINKIKLVHVHFGLSQKVTAVLLKLINPGLKVVWHWRGDIQDDISAGKSFLIFLFYRIMASSNVAAHIANSNNIYSRILDRRIVPTKRLYVIPNAVDINKFDINDYKTEIIKLGSQLLSKDLFTIIMIRNFRANVDFKIILDTMEELKTMDYSIQLLWIGYGETAMAIKTQIESRHLTNIKLLGKVSDPVPYYYISKINIVAWEPWCKETINNTVYEALMCELPVIGLNFGGLPNSFNENEGVFTVPLDGKKYAQKIIYIKNNYSSILSDVIKGKSKVINEYSTQVYMQKLFFIYKNILNS